MQLPDSLAGRLLGWYAAGHRALPWREDHEPYHVWLSEIMLQQTRVEAVKGYYARFLSELPDIGRACSLRRKPPDEALGGPGLLFPRAQSAERPPASL